MLKSLSLQNFTVFPDAQFKFGKNLNVIIGENGTGKTHVLKTAYSILAVSARGAIGTKGDSPTKSYLQAALASKLRGVLMPDELGRLTRRQAGRSRSEVGCRFDNPKLNLEFSFNTTSKREVSVEVLPAMWGQEVPVYLPTRELLTIAPGFVSLYETTQLPFEETWRDTAVLLQAPLARGPRERNIRELLKPLEEAMDGKVDLDSAGRFYLKTRTGRIEMHLVAEGIRKLAMIARLIATGSLLGKGSLFWDEPESNLNPRTVKAIARIILQIAESGVQVFIATHSLFLLRELYILESREFASVDSRYFGLHAGEAGAVSVAQGQTMDDVGEIAALDEELMQSERYLETEERLGVEQMSVAPGSE